MIAQIKPVSDPRTVARDIPGLFDALFPQLAQGIVASFNRKSISLRGCEVVPQYLVAKSNLQKAMLFEIAVALAEQLIDEDKSIDWSDCIRIAVQRQRQYFDAQPPQGLADSDKSVACGVAKNLVAMLRHLQSSIGDGVLVRAPRIPGYQWVASGVGDFSIGTILVEVKCTNKHFSLSDYRQILMYWLLSYCAAIENGAAEWSEGVLLNPRLNLFVRFSFKEVLAIIGAGKSKVEFVELFAAMLGTRNQGDFLETRVRSH